MKKGHAKSAIAKAISAIKKGVPVVILDHPMREGEADLVLHASFCTKEKIRLMRKAAGGLICLGISKKIASALQLPYMADLLHQSNSDILRSIALKKAPYGDKPAFSIWINHKKTYTGITDEDRSITITEFEKMIKSLQEKKITEEEMRKYFAKNFYSPGHVPMLIARSLNERKGHTELSIKLSQLAGLTPAVVMCEMLGDRYKALEWKKAKQMAEKNGWVAVRGEEIINA